MMNKLTTHLTLIAVLALFTLTVSFAHWRAQAAGSAGLMAGLRAKLLDHKPAGKNAAAAPVKGASAAAAVFATITVTNTNDSGAGSLRQAILDSNASVGVFDTIEFNLSAGTPSIALTSALPDITDPVTINGNTGLSTRVELNGAAAGSTPGLRILAGNSTIAGLVINRFAGNGIGIATNGGNTIRNCYIGTDAVGTTDLGNTLRGVFIASANNTIGGTSAADRNVISGNGADGVYIVGATATGNKVLGNYIGTDVNGTADLGNSLEGVFIDNAPSNTIGGTTATASNLISGNDGDAVFINGAAATGNTVIGNYIGTDATGTAALGNTKTGVFIQAAPGNTIGGTTAGERNVISGSKDEWGVGILGTAATGNKVIGNYIGTDATGTADLGNSRDGVEITSAPNNTIGGTTAAERNVISGNDRFGVHILGANSSGNIVIGNYLGTNAAGTAALGNVLDGVLIENAPNNTIGGTTATASNLISGNNRYGVRVFGTTSTGNVILGNAIFNNTNLGIDLGQDAAVTANDAGDGDTGANNLQNFPVLTCMTNAGGVTTIGGTLNSLATTAFRIEYFVNDACDASGNGEGQTLLSTQNVTTDGSGNAPLTLTVPLIAVGKFITATATRLDAMGNPVETSEFSQCLAITAPPTLAISDVTLAEGNAGTTNFVFTVTLTGAQYWCSPVTVNYATANDTALAGSDYTTTSGTLTFSPPHASNMVTQMITVPVTGDTTVEANETFFVNLSSPTNATITDNQGLGTITNDDCQTANAGPDQTLCDTSATLAANTPTFGTGSWSIISGAGGSVTTPSSPTSAFTGVAGTTYTLRWTISNAPCTASTDDVVITLTANPTAANAGPDQTVCATSATLAANTATVGTGAWSIVSGAGGSVTTPSSPTSAFTGVAGTTYTLRWTISNAPCTASTDDVVITLAANPTVANAGPDQTLCATSATLAANTATVGTGAWSIVSGAGGSVTPPSSPTSAFTGVAGTTYTLRWTISNAPCTASTDDVVITFTSNPTTANAGPDQTLCATSATLAANAATVGTGAWSIVSGAGGAVTAPSNPTSAFTGVAGTTYTLRWTISNSPCTVSTDDVVITLKANPTVANAGPDQTLCATSATLAANTATVGTGAWSIISGAGGTVTTPTSPTSGFTGVMGTTYTLRWTISNAPCTASADDVVIAFVGNPTTANAGPDQTLCATSATLTANPATVGTGAWSIISGAGGAVTAPSSPTSGFTGVAGTTYTLRWTISNSPCTASTDEVVITLKANPTVANAGPDQTVCATATTLAGNTPTFGTGAWTIISGAGGTVTTPSSPTSAFTGVIGATYTLRWTISNAPCAVSTDDVVINLVANPTISISDVTQAEGNAGTTAFTFNVTLSAAHACNAVTVNYATADGTATVADGDYAAVAATTLTFNPGETSKTVTVNVTGDTKVETNETFFVNLSGATNATIAKTQGVGTITNDDVSAANALTAQLADPAVCIDPGGLVGVRVTVTNTNNTAQTASWNVTLPVGLTALAGSCAADVNPGGCVVAANGGSLAWNGTLAANQTVNIIYRARIGANVAPGAQLCLDNQANVGGFPLALQFCFNVVCPSITNARVSDQKAGSVLVFPYYTSTIGGASDTRLTISHFGEGTGNSFVHLFLLDGATCQQADLFLCLTPNASFSFKASDYDPGNTGYVIAVAVNAQGVPIQNNVLSGDAFVRTPSVVGNYGAESFAANSFAVATVDGNTATLYFDQVGYDAVPKQFAVEVQSPLDAVGQQVVTAALSGNLVTSQLSGAAQVGTGLAFNGKEVFTSFASWLTGTCQARATITTNSPRVPNGLGNLIKTGQTGYLKFNVGAAVGLLLTPTTATWKGIRALHKTQTTATTLTIPVLAPVC